MTRGEYARRSRLARRLLDRAQAEILDRIEFTSTQQREAVAAVLERELATVRAQVDQADEAAGVCPPLRLVHPSR